MIRMMLHVALLVGFLLVHDTEACMDPLDRITHMPGLDQPLPSPWYSGYLEYEFHGHTIHTHYVLVKAEDLGEEVTDKPLIYWTNGGPGASSLFGLMTELGPLLFSDDSLTTDDDNEMPKPIYNPKSWTRLGTLLIVDQPAPIGFSYCDDNVTSHQCLSWTDELAAANTHEALETFFEKYPCMEDMDLFITGESYGGIYVPTLVREILKDDDSPMKKNLRGFAVGDGCLGTETGICSVIEGTEIDIWIIMLLFGHGQLPMKTFREFTAACRPHPDTWDLLSADDAACQEVIKKIEKQAGGFYAYNLYDDCTYRNGMLKGALNDYECGGDIVLEQYFNQPEVLKAFHLPDNYFSVDNAIGFDYTPTEADLRPFYKSVAEQNMANLGSEVRMLIYNGDADPAITSLATENWTSHLGLEEIEEWRAWTVDGCRRMGGYVTRYDGGLEFLTIRGAGHMVPTYKPDATFAFISAWIKNEPYLNYDPHCTDPTVLNHHHATGNTHKDTSAKVANG